MTLFRFRHPQSRATLQISAENYQNAVLHVGFLVSNVHQWMFDGEEKDG